VSAFGFHQISSSDITHVPHLAAIFLLLIHIMSSAIPSHPTTFSDGVYISQLSARDNAALISTFGHLVPQLESITGHNTFNTRAKRAEAVLLALLPNHPGKNVSRSWIQSITALYQPSSPTVMQRTPRRSPTRRRRRRSPDHASDSDASTEEGGLDDDQRLMLRELQQHMLRKNAERDQGSAAVEAKVQRVTDELRAVEQQRRQLEEQQGELKILRDALLQSTAAITEDLKQRWLADPQVRERMKQEARTEVEGHYASERQSWRTELARAEQEVSQLREKIAAHEQREMKHEHEKAETERQFAEARQQWQAGSVENVASQLREKIAAQEAQIAAQAEQITSLDPHAQASLKDHRVKLQRAEDLVVSLREKIVLQDQQLQRLRRTSGTP
jgi:hypothetical protein